MIKREDFPPGVPRETVDRILAHSADSERISFQTTLGIVVGGVIGIGLMVTAILLRWPVWTQGAALGVFAVLVKGSQFIGAKRQHSLTAKGGHECPQCHAPVFSDTWSASKATAERDAVMSGFCPRCFERIGPNLLAQVEKDSA